MSPGDLLNKTLAAGRLRKLTMPSSLSKAQREGLARLDGQIVAVRKRIEALEGLDGLAKANALTLPRAQTST